MKVRLASSWTLKSWNNRLTGLLCSLALRNAEPWPWAYTIPGNSPGWALIDWGAALLWEEAGIMVQRAEPKFVVVVRQDSHRLGCISPKVARSSRGEGRDYFPLLSSFWRIKGLLSCSEHFWPKGKKLLFALERCPLNKVLDIIREVILSSFCREFGTLCHKCLPSSSTEDVDRVQP